MAALVDDTDPHLGGHLVTNGKALYSDHFQLDTSNTPYLALKGNTIGIDAQVVSHTNFVVGTSGVLGKPNLTVQSYGNVNLTTIAGNATNYVNLYSHGYMSLATQQGNISITAAGSLILDGGVRIRGVNMPMNDGSPGQILGLVGDSNNAAWVDPPTGGGGGARERIYHNPDYDGQWDQVHVSMAEDHYFTLGSSINAVIFDEPADNTKQVEMKLWIECPYGSTMIFGWNTSTWATVVWKDTNNPQLPNMSQSNTLIECRVIYVPYQNGPGTQARWFAEVVNEFHF
jgi:hypothetical protein